MTQKGQTSSYHILVVDDDDRLRTLIKQYLSGHGFRVTEGRDAAHARNLIETFDFDLAIVDIMMPGEDGISLTKDWAANGVLPIILLTARDGTNDRIEGLKAGADDYLPKPFEPEELVLRIKSILRRAPKAAPIAELLLGRVHYNIEQSSLWNGDTPIRLSPAEATLMGLMAQTPNIAVPRWKLAEALGEGGDRTVDVHVTRLRKKLEPNPKAPVYLRTQRGVGYVLVPDA